jgi:glycerol-3-phosphate cytidylyltransferase
MPDFLNKIKSLAELEKIVTELKKQGKSIITTNGCYDILHLGHILSLNESKEQGDILIVGLNSDQSVKKIKGSIRPINGQEDRAKTLAALEFVDYVFIFNEETPIEFLKILKPNIHTNSIDYGYDCIEASTIKAGGGKIYLLKKYPGYSTSDLIKRIKK